MFYTSFVQGFFLLSILSYIFSSRIFYTLAYSRSSNKLFNRRQFDDLYAGFCAVITNTNTIAAIISADVVCLTGKHSQTIKFERSTENTSWGICVFWVNKKRWLWFEFVSIYRSIYHIGENSIGNINTNVDAFYIFDIKKKKQP